MLVVALALAATLAIHTKAVDQSVYSTLTVRIIEHASIINATIHVQVFAEQTLYVKL